MSLFSLYYLDDHRLFKGFKKEKEKEKEKKNRNWRYSVENVTDVDYTGDLALLANTPAKIESL